MREVVIYSVAVLCTGSAAATYLIHMVGLHPDTVFYPSAVIGIVLLSWSHLADRYQAHEQATDPTEDGGQQ